MSCAPGAVALPSQLLDRASAVGIDLQLKLERCAQERCCRRKTCSRKPGCLWLFLLTTCIGSRPLHRDVVPDYSRVLGQGMFGTVIAGTYHGRPVAIKSMRELLSDDDGDILFEDLEVFVQVRWHAVGLFSSAQKQGATAHARVRRRRRC